MNKHLHGMLEDLPSAEVGEKSLTRAQKKNARKKQKKKEKKSSERAFEIEEITTGFEEVSLEEKQAEREDSDTSSGKKTGKIEKDVSKYMKYMYILIEYV